MHCAGCVGKVEAALAGLDGVSRPAVSLEPGIARVMFDAARREPGGRLVEVIRNLGYAGAGSTEDEGALSNVPEWRRLVQAHRRRRARDRVRRRILAMLRQGTHGRRTGAARPERRH